MKTLVQERRGEFAFYMAEPNPPRRIRTKGEKVDVYESDMDEVPKTSGKLRGIAASAGFARGEVVVMREFDLSVDVKGKILVTEQTDPGWTLIFPLIKGIITERGNMLSHAAIVSRELRIPAVLAIPEVTNILQSGMEVEIDGKAGSVDIIKIDVSK